MIWGFEKADTDRNHTVLPFTCKHEICMVDTAPAIVIMALLTRNTQKIVWIGGGLLLLLVIGFIYSTFFKRNATSPVMGLLVTGLLLGAALMFLVSKLTASTKQAVVKEDSHTIVESMRKVFKVVFAEGHFNELY